MKKVYKFTLLSLLSLLILLTTFLVGCSNKPTAENTPYTPTYPQTWETNTSRDVFQEMVNYIKKSNKSYVYLDPDFVIDENNIAIARDIRLYYDSTNDTLELLSNFDVKPTPTSTHFQLDIQLIIHRQTNYNTTDYIINGRRFQSSYTFSATIPNTPKDFREQLNDTYPIRNINYDNITFQSVESKTAVAADTSKCLSAILPIFDSFFRQKLRYFPDKLWNGTVLPTEVSQYAILSYFHLPVAVKINPQVKS